MAQLTSASFDQCSLDEQAEPAAGSAGTDAAHGRRPLAALRHVARTPGLAGQPVYLQREIRESFILLLVILAAALEPFSRIDVLVVAILACIGYAAVRWYRFASQTRLREASRYLLAVYVMVGSLLLLLWTMARLVRQYAQLSLAADISLTIGLILLGALLLLGGDGLLSRYLGLRTAREATCAPSLAATLHRLSWLDRWFLRYPESQEHRA